MPQPSARGPKPASKTPSATAPPAPARRHLPHAPRPHSPLPARHARLLARTNTTVDEILTREIEDVACAHADAFSVAIPGFDAAMEWPDVAIGLRVAANTNNVGLALRPDHHIDPRARGRDERGTG